MSRHRLLSQVEIRVLGCLLEKEQTTPDLYPLTIHAVIAAANQKSNREPVTELSETAVVEALDALRHEALTWRNEGARAERWSHLLDRRWGLDKAAKAVMTLLLLRGAQTPGELRARSDRLHEFAAVEEVERVLARLMAAEDPLVAELPRQPSKREVRFTVTVGAQHAAPLTHAAPSAPSPHSSPPLPSGPSLAERVTELEAAVAELSRELANLKQALGA